MRLALEDLLDCARLAQTCQLDGLVELLQMENVASRHRALLSGFRKNLARAIRLRIRFIRGARGQRHTFVSVARLLH